MFRHQMIRGGPHSVNVFRINFFIRWRQYAITAQKVAAAQTPGQKRAEITPVNARRKAAKVAVKGCVLLAEVTVNGLDNPQAHGAGDSKKVRGLAAPEDFYARVQGHNSQIFRQRNLAK